MFTLTQLAGFVAVADELHFGRAAERLHITQPPLTRQVQALERILATPLFDRSGRGIQLTAAGRAFLSDARRLLRDAEASALAARRVARGEAGALAIGCTAAGAQAVLGPIVSALRARLPGVDIVLREAVTDSQLDAIAGGDLDIALARPPTRLPGLSSREIHRERLMVALPEGHALGEAQLVCAADLAAEDMVMYAPKEARYFYELVVTALQPAGFPARFVQHVSQIHTMLVLVAAGLGVALVPESSTQAARPGVSFHAFETADATPVRLNAVWREANANPSLPVALEVIAELAR